MKILVLADIHSNWAALSAIDEDFDACLIVGDLVDYGIDPVPCIAWAQKHDALMVRGNHDHAVAQHVAPRGGSGSSFRTISAWSRPIHWKLLDESQLSWLARLPVTRHLELDGLSFFLVHATPRDPLDEHLGPDSDGWKQRLANIDADFVVVGHTHVPICMDLGGKTLLNPGSVGQPRDGDPRASYAIVEDGEVRHCRVEYPVEDVIADAARTDADAQTLAIFASVLRTGGRFEESSRS